MTFATCDLCDEFDGKEGFDLRVVAPMFKSYGANGKFNGQIETLKVFEDNSLLRTTLASPGQGKVLVVDGGGSLRCALLGDLLGALGVQNGWAGIVVWGCIRDSAVINAQNIGVRALDTHPRKSIKKDVGERNIAVSFGGVRFAPGDWLYADQDGIIVSAKPLF